ncbi:MAG TPA: SsrA-binding protein SmpB [Gemmatimonadota bacterium]|nr:SsrA-binding protein SmpB [Gemmatimonadota bacterium]
MGAETTVARNRKARHDYEILDTVEAGLVLRGAEVKSVREGRVNLQDGWATVEGGEAWLNGVHISPYDPASRWNVDPVRRRKLLLSRDQIQDLAGRVFEKGLTLVPLDVHFRNGFAKVTLAVARGKQKHDKRESIRRREMERDMERHAGRR